MTARRARAGSSAIVGAEKYSKASQGQIRPKSPREARKRQESPLEAHLAWTIQVLGLPEPEREYRFHPVRRFRLDFAWPAFMLAVEVEGGVYRGGGHTSVAGIKRDIEKGNLLTMAGWRVLRFHGDQVKNGEAIALIRQALKADR